MVSARNVSQSIRRWSSLAALPFVAGLALAACGGKVVVDGNGGEGGAGGTGSSESSAAVTPSTGSSGLNTCDAAVAHLKSCDPVKFGQVPPTPSCEGKVLCKFTCLLATSCEGLVGPDLAAAQQFTTCLNACG